MDENLNTSPPNSNVELTQEVNTGYTFDNKPVYERVIQFTAPSDNKRASIQVDFDFSKVTVISFNGVIDRGNLYLDLNYNDGATMSCVYVATTYISMQTSNSACFSKPCRMIVRYTKK